MNRIHNHCVTYTVPLRHDGFNIFTYTHKKYAQFSIFLDLDLDFQTRKALGCDNISVLTLDSFFLIPFSGLVLHKNLVPIYKIYT